MKGPPLIGCWFSHVVDSADNAGRAVGEHLDSKHEDIRWQHGTEGPPTVLIHLPYGNVKDGKDYNIDARDGAEDPGADTSLMRGVANLLCEFHTSDIAGYFGAPYKTVPAQPYREKRVEEWCWPFLNHRRLIPAFDASNNSAPKTAAGQRVAYAKMRAYGRTMREAWPLARVPHGVGPEAGPIGTPLNYWKDRNCDWICGLRLWRDNVRPALAAGDANLVPPEKVAGRIWLWEDWSGFHKVTRADYDLAIEAYRLGFSLLITPPHPDNVERMTAAEIASAAQA